MTTSLQKEKKRPHCGTELALNFADNCLCKKFPEIEAWLEIRALGLWFSDASDWTRLSKNIPLTHNTHKQQNTQRTLKIKRSHGDKSLIVIPQSTKSDNPPDQKFPSNTKKGVELSETKINGAASAKLWKITSVVTHCDYRVVDNTKTWRSKK